MINIEEYLRNFDVVTKEPSLEAMEYFMREFGNPHKKMKFIHIAGTNGKGSVCEMINNVLINAGYKVGKYISPHLTRYNERITINNVEITDKQISDILEKLSKKVTIYNKTHEVPVKEFEVVTTLALLYFAQKECDIVVLETGLGGIDDCTNIADGMISIITDVGLDHMDILGNTVEEIADKKSGIIKKNKDTIMCYQEKVTDIIIKKCKKENNTLHLVNKKDVINYSFTEQYQQIDYKENKNIKINLKGKCQIYNAAIVLECIDVLKQKGYIITQESIKKGLSTVIHKARFETLNKRPNIIFDGGHNENAIQNLKSTINQYYNKITKVYIVSILKTKDFKTVIRLLSEDKNSIFIFTTGNDENKYVSKEELYEEAKKYLSKNIYKINLKEAINFAKNTYKDKLIMIIGSFYVYKDVIEFIKDNN